LKYSVSGNKTTYYYDSSLTYAIPLLDNYLKEHIHYQGDRKDSIPIRGIIESDCEHCGGHGTIKGDCGDGSDAFGKPECNETCKSCKGAGKRNSFNQGDTISISETLLQNSSGISALMGWINPDTKIVEQSSDILQRLAADIEKALFIRQTESAAQQSGEAKKIDLQAANMFISGVSSNVYRVVKSLLLSIASYIQMTGKPDIMFIENTTFILKDSEDYIAEMERFVKMGDIRGAKQIEYKLKIGEGDEVGAFVTPAPI